MGKTDSNPAGDKEQSSSRKSVCINCSPTSSSTVENIHINSIYVYNFSSAGSDVPSICSPANRFHSPVSSGGPICRICHEGDNKEDLVSPCRCTGSVGVVHKSCMERWLSTRCHTSDKCEICNYTFLTSRTPKSIIQWLRSDYNDGNHRRRLLGDFTCFSLLTPLALVSSVLCIEGSKRRVTFGKSVEAGCLMALATFIITVYICWTIIMSRYHLKESSKWRSCNQTVKLLRVQRVSTATEAAVPVSPDDVDPLPLGPWGGEAASSSIVIRMPETV